jgi:hypothetical protein
MVLQRPCQPGSHQHLCGATTITRAPSGSFTAEPTGRTSPCSTMPAIARGWFKRTRCASIGPAGASGGRSSGAEPVPPQSLHPDRGAPNCGNRIQPPRMYPEKPPRPRDSRVAGAGLEQSPDFQGKTGVAGSGGAESGAVAPVFASFSDWLDACPVDLDDATRERVRAVIGDGCQASI